MNTLRNQSGFGTLMALVILGVIAVTMAASADSLTMLFKTQRDTTSNTEITSLVSRVQSIVNTQWSCTASLGGANYLQPITMMDPVNPGVTIAASGTSSGSFWTISQLSMSNVQPVAGRPGVLTAELDLQFTKNMKYQAGAPVLARSISSIAFAAAPDGTITQCYPSTTELAAANAACLSLGGVWNNAQPYGSQCSVNVTNPTPSPSSSPSAPNGICFDANAGVIALPNSSVVISGNGTVKSDVYLLNQAQLTLSGNAKIDGNVIQDAGTGISAAGNSSCKSVTQQDLSGYTQSISDFASAQTALTPTEQRANISDSTELDGCGAKNVIQVNGDLDLTGNNTLTLSGSSTDVFVINVIGKITVSGNGGIVLKGGVLPKNVLFNNVGAGNEMVISGNGSVAGTFIAPQRGADISGNGSLTGAVIAGGGLHTKVTVSGNGMAMTPSPFCVSQ